MLYKKLPRNWRNWEYAAGRKGNTEKRRRLEESLTQHDQKSRTVSLFFCDPDLLSSYDIPTFLIKLLLLRVQESRAATLECRNTRENMSIPGNVLTVNMLDEILKNYTIIQEFWQHHRESLMISRILRTEGIEKSGSEKPLDSILLPCSSVRTRRNVLTTNESYVYD